MPGDLFETEAWFANLLAHGFEQPPHQHRAWQLPSAPCGEAAHFHLMQQRPGGPLVALSNYYSGLYGPVGSAEAVHGLSAAQWQAAAKALRRLPGSAVLRLQPLDAASNWLPALEAGLRTAGYWTSRYFAFGNWYQPVPAGGFAPYWADRPSALRHSVERGRRRLAKAGAWRIDIVTAGALDDAVALDTALAAYQTVYAPSWKQPEPCPDFMPSLVRLAARQGWLRLGVLWLNDQPLASQVWLVFGAKANIYKLAYVKGQDRLSAGSVLTAALMQHAMDVDKVHEVDYLSGDDTYKADWMALRRERVGLVAFDRKRLSGLWGAGRHALGRAKKRLMDGGRWDRVPSQLC
jgi:hypothetical protein